MKICNSVIIIPVLNPDDNLKNYIENLVHEGVKKIIVVDDGSGKKYREKFRVISEIPECILYTHEINKGKGRALKDALKLYQEKRLNEQFNGVITVDADGQHLVSDVLKISEEMNIAKNELILGERNFDRDVPLRSRFGNSCTRIIFRLLYGMDIDDTQTGLRGIPNKLITEFDDLEGERYEYEMNMLMMCSLKKINIRSITIETVYLNNNTSSHFNAVKDSFRIYKLLLKTFLKFVLSSLSSSIIDIVLFQVLVFILKGKCEQYILFSTIGARICSSFYNYTVNKKVVFGSEDKIAKSLVKYYLLCVVQMIISAIGVTGVYMLIPINETVIKVLVDVLLFFISYRIQKVWIFNQK